MKFNELLLPAFLEELPAFVYWVDANSRLQGCNKRFLRWVGATSLDTVLMRRLDELPCFSNYATYLNEWQQNNEKALLQSCYGTYQEILPISHVNLVECCAHKIPLFDTQNVLCGLLNFSLDVSVQHKTELELHEENKALNMTLNTILNLIPGHVYWQNCEGVLLGCNTRQAQSLGYASREDIIGRHLSEVVPEQEAQELLQRLQHISKTGESIAVEENLSSFGGAMFLSQKVPLRSETGEIVGILGISMDITKQKQIEQQLIEEKERAETANRVKTEFIQNMEHDIRTPFSGMWGLTFLLWEQETDPQKKEYLNDILYCSKELLNYCNTILDFSRVEQGDFPVIDKKFQLASVIDGVIALEKPAIIQKKLEFEVQLPPNLPKVLVGDSYRLFRILVNLISNSVKFTEIGKITLSIEVVSRSEKKIILRFLVKDTGVGIPENKLDFIFERFTRLTASNRGLVKGLGLGLRVVKQFVAEMEGDLEVVSKVDEGSVFACTLPFQLPLIDALLQDST